MILASIFRDSSDYIDRYAAQVKALREHVHVEVIAVEGDSTDDTYERLCGTDFEVLKVEHGGPKFGSFNIALRWRQIAAVCNVALCAAVRRNAMPVQQPFVYVESDLLWEPETILALTDQLDGDVHAIAPMSLVDGTQRFWDIWGHTKDGIPFSPMPPYHPHLRGTQRVPIDTAGSCFALSPEVLPLVQFSPVDCIRGIGRSLTLAGHQLWLDPTLKVWHDDRR